MPADSRTIAFLRRTPDVGADAFATWLQGELVGKGQPWSRSLYRCVLNEGVPPPAGAQYGVDAGMVRPSYDVAVELWYASAEGALHAGAGFAAALSPLVDGMHLAHTTPTVIWNRQDVSVGQRTPGIKYMPLLKFHDDLPDAAARRCWGIHANLARKVHVGCSRYVQNWIEAVHGTPEFHARGIPELFFPTDEAFVKHFFDSPRGKEEIVHDVSHFVEAGQRYFWREFVLA